MLDDDSELEIKLRETSERIKKIDDEISELSDRRKLLIVKRDLLRDRQHLQRSLSRAEQNWDSENFPWLKNIKTVLRLDFKMQELRKFQLKTINAIMSKNDVLLLAPTGGGKSLCYQLPAVTLDGVTIVISPLISLMEDQVWALQRLNIAAFLLSSTTDKLELNLIMHSLSSTVNSNSLKILYVTPERLAKSKRFMAALQKCHVAKRLEMFAIDEVHCCSEWGHDFRKDYNYLNTLKKLFPDVPILGVTATATSKVIVDVQKMLNINDCLVFKDCFNRPNLYYHVMEKPIEREEVYNTLADLLLHRYKNQSGIIYTFSIKDATEIAAELKNRELKVAPYHASLEYTERSKIHRDWIDGDIQAVIATVAFGMGIDKPDVRFVIHHTLSKSMENFYQESGRAGRDGERADCIIMYRFADIFRISTMVFGELTGLQNAYDMINYCIDGSLCRRNMISKHFTEVWEDGECESMCDFCYDPKSDHEPMNLAKYCRDIYTILDNAEMLNTKLTGLKLIDSWFHKGASNLRVKHLKPPSCDRFVAEQIVAALIIQFYLREDFTFTAYATISYIQRGSKSLTAASVINFYPAKSIDLPSLTAGNTDNMQNHSPNSSQQHSKSKTTKKWQKIKRKRSSSSSSSRNKKVGNSSNASNNINDSDEIEIISGSEEAIIID